MSLAPLVFVFLGAALGMRIKKGGRGTGAVLSLCAMLGYYLTSLIGEQMARAGTLEPFVGAWLATGLALFACGLLLWSGRGRLGWGFGAGSADGNAQAGTVSSSVERASSEPPAKIPSGRLRPRLLAFPILLDLSLFRALLTSFIFGFISLVAIFLVFTLFELWRSIAATRSGVRLIIEYLYYLLPLATVELLPASLLVAVLATYALLSRRSEAVAWWASGQSVYRLGLPGLLFAIGVGACLWGIQERLMPEANLRQDALRSRIQGRDSRLTTATGRQWLAAAGSNRIYAYEYGEAANTLKNPVVYDFDAEGIHLARVISAEQGVWTSETEMEMHEARAVILGANGLQTTAAGTLKLEGVEPQRVFKPSVDKPSQLSAKGLSAYISTIKRRGVATGPLSVALQHKYAEPFSTIVLALIGIPLALSFGRRNAITALSIAVFVGLAFWGTVGGFQQLGAYGLLPPPVAGWAPLVVFAATGAYLSARART